MNKPIDCVVCGSCTVDVLARPVSLSQPIGVDQLHSTEPIELTTGGLVSNSGVAMARLGLRTAAFSYVGDDTWGDVIRGKYQSEGIDTSRLETLPGVPSSVTLVMVDSSGQRSFIHSQGAPKRLSPETFLNALDFFAGCRMMLIGYYSLMPHLESDLPEIFRRVRGQGCQVALDTAGDGGSMSPLDRILPHVDYYVPNWVEARHQTGREEPAEIVAAYRKYGCQGVVGVKLGSQGSLLSTPDGELLRIPAITPPGPVVDTTGAGDAYYAGLISGILGGLPLPDAAKLASAAGALCVTALGATAGLGDNATTRRLAGLDRDFA